VGKTAADHGNSQQPTLGGTMFPALAIPTPTWSPHFPETLLPSVRHISLLGIVVTLGALVGFAVAVVTLAAGHGDLLSQMQVFKGVKEIKGVTEFLEDIKGYLLSIVLAGFTIAAIGAGAAKFVGHSRANDLVFNIGVGVAIFAAIPTLAA
jgi:hypothetical protein